MANTQTCLIIFSIFLATTTQFYLPLRFGNIRLKGFAKDASQHYFTFEKPIPGEESGELDQFDTLSLLFPKDVAFKDENTVTPTDDDPDAQTGKTPELKELDMEEAIDDDDDRNVANNTDNEFFFDNNGNKTLQTFFEKIPEDETRKLTFPQMVLRYAMLVEDILKAAVKKSTQTIRTVAMDKSNDDLPNIGNIPNPTMLNFTIV